MIFLTNRKCNGSECVLSGLLLKEENSLFPSMNYCVLTTESRTAYIRRLRYTCFYWANVFSRLLNLEILAWMISNNEHIICWTVLKITVEVDIWLHRKIRGTTRLTGIYKIKKWWRKAFSLKRLFSKINNNEVSPRVKPDF